MSILIKGMEMPTCCADCELNYDCFCCAITGHNFFIEIENFDFTKEKAFDCPLVEVPTHGRLHTCVYNMKNVCVLHSEKDYIEYCHEGPCSDEKGVLI